MKLTKAQEKRAYSSEATREDILDIINEAVEARLADELSRQKKEIIEKLEKMQDKSQSSASLVWNDTIDQAIKTIKGR